MRLIKITNIVEAANSATEYMRDQPIGMIMKKYLCTICGYVYDPSLGDPGAGVTPGTRFDELPEDWYCPVCGVSKEDFEAVE